jgi:predicted dehydrogenase
MKNEQMIRNRKVRWGIAGCGRFAEVAVAPAITKSRTGELVAFYSHSLKRAKALAAAFQVKRAYDDYDAFVHDSEIDAVYIASPNNEHYAQVIGAARAKKHILCEKPMALTSREAKKMVEECKKQNVKLMIGYIQRFHNLHRKAREIAQSGRLGKLVFVSISQAIDFPWKDNFRLDPKRSGGGASWDIGTHCIDFLRFIGGEVSHFDGMTDAFVYDYKVDDSAVGCVRFVDGGFGLFYCAYNIKKPTNHIEILGHKGTIVIEGTIGRARGGTMTIDVEGEKKQVLRSRCSKMLNEIRSFENAILHNLEPEVTGEDGLINLQLMERFKILNQFRLRN